MRTVALIVGLLFCVSTLIDAFQTIILPRRPVGRFRVTYVFYAVTWGPWAAFARRASNPKVREQLYSIYGPASLLLLLALWALLLVTGYACLFFALGTPFTDPFLGHSHLEHFRTDFYVSGTTLFTLGLGDVVPPRPCPTSSYRRRIRQWPWSDRSSHRIRSRALQHLLSP